MSSILSCFGCYSEVEEPSHFLPLNKQEYERYVDCHLTRKEWNRECDKCLEYLAKFNLSANQSPFQIQHYQELKSAMQTLKSKKVIIIGGLLATAPAFCSGTSAYLSFCPTGAFLLAGSLSAIANAGDYFSSLYQSYRFSKSSDRLQDMHNEIREVVYSLSDRLSYKYGKIQGKLLFAQHIEQADQASLEKLERLKETAQNIDRHFPEILQAATIDGNMDQQEAKLIFRPLKDALQAIIHKRSFLDDRSRNESSTVMSACLQKRMLEEMRKMRLEIASLKNRNGPPVEPIK